MPLASRLLALLRQRRGAFVSGEEFSSLLGVSRTAVWKHIHQLAAAGYRIEVVPHLGYQLRETPDRLLPDEILSGLTTKLLGRPSVCFEETTSTNDRALALAVQGAAEGTIVAAENQTQGRGRIRRAWHSKAGANLLFSLILKPGWTIEQAPLLTLLAAAAVTRAIRSHTGLPAMIKWPNDVLIRGGKVAGILTEMQTQAERILFVVCGIGVNVNAAPAGNLKTPAVSLAGLLGKPLLRLPLLRSILQDFEELYLEAKKHGQDSILRHWEAYSCMNSAQVRIDLPGEACLEGTALGVDETGALLVRLDGGTIRRVISGEVSLILAEAKQ